MIKQLSQAALAAELDSHLAWDINANRKKDSSRKTVKTPTGAFEQAIPRQHNGSFELHPVKKHQTTLSDEIERAIIGMFALGMSYKDISQKIESLYAFSVSSATPTELKQWQQHPLETVSPFVTWMCLFYYAKISTYPDTARLTLPTEHSRHCYRPWQQRTADPTSDLGLLAMVLPLQHQLSLALHARQHKQAD
nr:transposase [Serratia symbiotica]